MPERTKPTSDKLRNAIDHGRAGDKVNFSDPAAAPLGTDDEAAGTPPTREQLQRAWEAEVANEARSEQAHPGRDRRQPTAMQPGSGRWTMFVVVLTAIVVLGAVLIAVVGV